jgi:hypothetical protein
LACIALALAGTWRAYVDRLRDGPSLEQPCRILACNPDQPGRLADRLADAGPEQLASALNFALLAVANEPASPFRWCNLGDLYLLMRNPAQGQSADYLLQARACFRRAEELAPSNPNILQRIANFYFQAGEPAEALPRTYRILQRVRDFDDIIFSTYTRFGVPQSDILSHGVPPDPAPVRSYLRFVFTRKDAQRDGRTDVEAAAAATSAWNWALSLPPTQPPIVTDALAKSYLNLLWREREFPSVVQAWAEYLGSHAGDYPRPNRIFNGGFETEISDENPPAPPPANPLDWRRDNTDGVHMQRDLQVQQQGQASMRITFQGTRNLEFHNFSQTQPVPPGVYRFKAMVMTESITTDQGVRIRILDPDAPARLDLSTPAMTGSSHWQPVELRVEVRPPTRLVRIEVARHPSLKFDSKIAGTLWLDAVSLTPAN